MGKAVVIFNGSRNERLGQGNILGGEGGVSAQVIVYAPEGKKYDDLVGYTMTSNADAYTPIDEGEYTAKRRNEEGSGQIPKHYQLFENGVDNIRTMDGVRNNNPKYRHQIRENGDGYKTEIFIHSTLDSNNKVGSKTSTGCLLLNYKSMETFDNLLSPLGNGYSFKVIVNRKR